MTKRFIGIKDLAEYLGIKDKTIRHWILVRQIPYYKTGHLVRFNLEEIEAWLQERKVTPLNDI